MDHKARNVLTATEQQELVQLRKFLAKSGYPPATIRRKLLYFQKFIVQGRQSGSTGNENEI